MTASQPPPRLLPVAIKITRTPLAGGAATVVEELITPKGRRRILDCRASKAQSIGDQGAELQLDNTGGLFNDWTSGDTIRVEFRQADAAEYTLFAEGFAGEPVLEAGFRARLALPVVGPNNVLRVVKLTQEHTFEDTPYTTIFDTLCSTYLSGYTRTITADASETPKATFAEGMTLYDALDFCRRALVAATSQKWEMLATKDGVTKTVKLYKRATTVQATIRARDLLRGSRRGKGNAWEVANKVTVTGANVVNQVHDSTERTRQGAIRIDSTTERLAQPFKAIDTPLYSVTVQADRSDPTTPPDLGVYVARSTFKSKVNGSGLSANNDSFLRRAGQGLIHRNATISSGVIGNIDDEDAATVVSFSVAAVETDKELVVWNILGGSTAPKVGMFVLRTGNVGTETTVRYKLWGSQDDSSYTLLADTGAVGSDTTYMPAVAGAPAGPYTFLKLTVSRSEAGAGAVQIREVAILEYLDSASPAPTNQRQIYEPGVSPESFAVAGPSNGGGELTEIIKYDFGAPKEVAKLVLRHQESATVTSSVQLKWQRSEDGAAWTDLAAYTGTTSDVVETTYVEEAPIRHLRLIMQDDRGGGSADLNATVAYADVFIGLSDAVSGNPGAPVPGDKMLGSPWTWRAGDMVKHPATFEPHTWAAPRIALVKGNTYFLVFECPTGASASAWWEIDHDNGAMSSAEGLLLSADAGVTWANATGTVASGLIRLGFRLADLIGTAEDTASQTKYANMVPGGILHASYQDRALVTKDMVDKVAEAIVKARGDVTDRFTVVTKFLPSVEVGSRVKLDADVEVLLGASGEKDVLEHVVDVGASCTSTLTLGDRPARASEADAILAALASRRTL